MNKKTKNGRVELLRFIFALMILFFHIQKRFIDGKPYIAGTGLTFFYHGNIGVEFFFLVSGWLMAAGCFAKRENPPELIGSETAGMMWKKIKNIFPYHLFAIVLTIAVNAYFLYDTAKDRAYYVIDSWASVFFLQVFGFQSTWVNKLTWYIDVWLMVTFVFYIFLRKYYDVFVKIVCPALALCVLGYLDYTYGCLSGIDTWTGGFYKCFLRGLAEMALGCSAYSLTRRINKTCFSETGKRIIAITELLGYILVALYACSGLDYKYEFPILFLLWGLVILTFSDINPKHEIFDKAIFAKLGKASLLIYLNQFYAIRLVQSLGADLGIVGKAIACILLTFFGSWICDMVVSSYQKKRPIHKLMIKNEGA